MPKNTLSVRTLWGYGFGDFGQNLVFQTIAIFLLPYLTDVVGISPALAGLIFLIARPFDGITDPLMGYLAQSYRSRWGTYRPFLLYAALPGALCFLAMFWVPDWIGEAKFVYALGVYLLFSICFTAFNIPYGALTAVMTQDYHERGKLTAYRMTFALLGGILAGYGTPELLRYFGNHQSMAGLYGGIMVFGLLISFFNVQEKSAENNNKGATLGDTLQMLRRNRPFWLVTLTFSCCFAAALAFSATIAYYFQYYLQKPEEMGMALLFFSGTTAISIPIWSLLSKRIGKRPTFLIGLSLSILALLAIFWLQPSQNLVLFVLLSVHGFGNGTAAFASWAMPADTIEYGQWLTGFRAEGMTYGIYGVFLKIGMAVGSGIVGIGLAGFGYVANQAQTETALWGIRGLMSLLPALFLFIAFVTMWQYRLSSKRHAEIRAALEKNLS